MTRLASLLALATAAAAATLGCESQPKSPEQTAARQASIDADANATVTRFRNEDPELKRFFDTAQGWAVFPRIAEGAFIVGGSAGDGVLFEGGRIVGDVSVAAGSVGLQAGGGTFSQIVFFETPETLASFKANTFAFRGNASAFAVRAGGGAQAAYENGVAVFVFNPTGLMAQLSVGGQRFTFRPR